MNLRLAKTSISNQTAYYRPLDVLCLLMAVLMMLTMVRLVACYSLREINIVHSSLLVLEIRVDKDLLKSLKTDGVILTASKENFKGAHLFG